MANKICPLCGQSMGLVNYSMLKLKTGEHLCTGCVKALTKAIPFKFSFKDYSVEDAKAALEKHKKIKNARCPQCRSANVEPLGRKRKAYSFKKAAAGAVLFTPVVGALVGFVGGNGKHEFYCRECGEIFKQ